MLVIRDKIIFVPFLPLTLTLCQFVMSFNLVCLHCDPSSSLCCQGDSGHISVAALPCTHTDWFSVQVSHNINCLITPAVCDRCSDVTTMLPSGFCRAYGPESNSMTSCTWQTEQLDCKRCYGGLNQQVRLNSILHLISVILVHIYYFLLVCH